MPKKKPNKAALKKLEKMHERLEKIGKQYSRLAERIEDLTSDLFCKIE